MYSLTIDTASVQNEMYRSAIREYLNGAINWDTLCDRMGGRRGPVIGAMIATEQLADLVKNRIATRPNV